MKYENHRTFEKIYDRIAFRPWSVGLNWIKFQDVLYHQGPRVRPERKDEFIILASEVIKDGK